MVRKNKVKAKGLVGKGGKNDVYAVILIGGKGKRLRPLSTDAKPKAFLSVTKDRKTMFRRTVDRAVKIVPKERVLVVANRAHAAFIRKDAPDLPRKNIILEPVSRNTAPAIALAARRLEDMVGEHIMVVLPTDQYIDETIYLKALKEGIEFVRRNRSALIIYGQKPSYPATGFGYIKIDSANKKISEVESFTEKPDEAKAERYLKDGRYLWNLSTFIFNVYTILGEFRKLAPAIYRGTGGLITKASYSKLPDISIDYAIMEKTGNIYCVKGDYRWQDMGSFDSLRKILKREGRKFVETDGKIISIL